MTSSATIPIRVMRHAGAGFAALLLATVLLDGTAWAQGLNWEGQTGAGITPFAYTSDSPANNFGGPQLSFHFLDTGDVIGRNLQSSVTVGFFQRAEFGYTRTNLPPVLRIPHTEICRARIISWIVSRSSCNGRSSSKNWTLLRICS